MLAALKNNFAGITDAEGTRLASDIVFFERASAVVSRRRDAYQNSQIIRLHLHSRWGGRRRLCSKAGSC